MLYSARLEWGSTLIVNVDNSKDLKVVGGVESSLQGSWMSVVEQTVLKVLWLHHCWPFSLRQVVCHLRTDWENHWILLQYMQREKCRRHKTCLVFLVRNMIYHCLAILAFRFKHGLALSFLSLQLHRRHDVESRQWHQSTTALMVPRMYHQTISDCTLL